MRLLLGSLGALLILFDLIDVIQSTLSVRGGGFLSSRLGGALWGVFARLHRRRPAHHVLAYAGPTLLVVTLSFWTALIWLGWTLVFLSDPDSVVSASSEKPGDIAAQFYFVGYSLITLGIGDYRPQGAFWQLATILATLQGFFVTSLAVSYLLSVLPAVVAKRQTALYLAALGPRPIDLVLRAAQKEGCSGLDSHLSILMEALGKLTEQHLAYPVLHYFHAPTKRSAFALRVAALDEALRYLRYGVRGCEAQQLEPLQKSITALLDALHAGFLDARDEPPSQSLTPLKVHGVTLQDEATFERAVHEDAVRRALLYSYVRRTGWEWRDVNDVHVDEEVKRLQ